MGRRDMDCMRKNKGFSIIELIMVIVVLGILAATAIYKFGSFGSIESDTVSVAAVDQAIADIQYVQMLAMSKASQQSISFTANSDSYTVAGETKKLPGDIKAGNTITFTFNSLGEPVAGGNQTVTIGGRQIKVWAITGKVEQL